MQKNDEKQTKHMITVRDGILKASNELGIPTEEVKKADLYTIGVSDWAIKRSGGLKKVRNAFFRTQDMDLSGIHTLNNTSNYISKLEKTIGSIESRKETLIEAVQSCFKAMPAIKPVSLKNSKKAALKRELVAMLNDTHIGLIVDPEEIGNINSFDFEQAGRRFAYFVREIVNYKPHARHETKKLHLILNGDIIAGIIHGLETKTIHLLTHQIAGAIHIIGNSIAHLAKDFEELEIHGVAGNHCRMIHKDHGKRPVAEVYDSYSNIIFYALSAMFANSKQIKFNFPKTAYGFLNLPAGRAMYAHGDHVFSKAIGNPGRAINVKAISEAIKDFNAGEIAKGNKPVKLLLLGHVHVFAHFITNDGVEVYVAPSLSGLDQFAHSLTINNNFIAQGFFESTEKYILGDSRLVRLNDADKDTSLEKIIPTYKKSLKWDK